MNWQIGWVVFLRKSLWRDLCVLWAFFRGVGDWVVIFDGELVVGMWFFVW